MDNSNSKRSPTSSGHRIIRSRTGATNAAGWLSQTTATTPKSTNTTTTTSEPTTPEGLEVVYLEVTEDENDNQKLKLLKCQRKAAMMSTLLADMLNQNAILSGRTVEGGAPVLPLTNAHCTATAIERVIAYCEYHCDDPLVGNGGSGPFTTSSPLTSPTTSNNNSYRSFDETMDDDRGGVREGGDHQVEESKYEIACYWDRSFIDAVAGSGLTSAEGRASLYDLLIAAHYLGIDRLVELGAKYICRQISGKSCEEVRTLLNIKSDLLEAEERRLHDENAVWSNDVRAAAASATKKK